MISAESRNLVGQHSPHLQMAKGMKNGIHVLGENAGLIGSALKAHGLLVGSAQ